MHTCTVNWSKETTMYYKVTSPLYKGHLHVGMSQNGQYTCILTRIKGTWYMYAPIWTPS